MKSTLGLTALDIPHGNSSIWHRSVPGAPMAMGTSPLPEVLWRRRLVIVLMSLACLIGAAVYLIYTSPVFEATSRLLIESEAPRVLRDSSERGSESFLQTQADVFTSASVLGHAIQTLDAKHLRTFSSVDGSLIEWLQTSGALRIEPAKKSDVMLVSMQSSVPAEAAAIANAVVDAYIAEQTSRRSATNGQMLEALRGQREALARQRDGKLAGMLKSQQNSSVVSYGDDKGNLALQRMSTLSNSLTEAHLAAIEHETQRAALEAAIKDPQVMRAYVEARQAQGRDFGDREYDELRNQLNAYEIAYAGTITSQGDKHPRSRSLDAVIQSLKGRIAQKQQSLASAEMASINTKLAAAKLKEQELVRGADVQRDRTMALSSSATEFRQLEADAAQLQRQVDLIDSRVAELSVEKLASVPLNLRVLETARLPDKPIKPRKAFVLMAALMAGWVLGIGAALVREWQDRRVRTPHEAQSLLNLPVLAAIPRMNARLSAPARGQVLRLDARSPGAEAYRSLCAAMRWGRAADSRTVLVTSPDTGDGKSTTASNLATSFAQAGHRTLLIDCDLRQPVQHLIFDADSTLGLSNVLAGDHKLQVAVCTTGVNGLYLLPAGPLPPNPSEMLGSKRFSQLLRALRGRFDRIVIDSPSIGACSDSLIVSAVADATLLVVRMNRSAQQSATAAIDSLTKVDARVVGVVANEVVGAAPDQPARVWEYAVPTITRQNGAAPLLNGSGVEHRRDELHFLEEPDWTVDMPGGHA